MMINLEQTLVELRSRLDGIAYPIQQLPSSKNHPDKNYAKLVVILNETYKRLIDLLGSISESPLFTSNDPNFMRFLRHDMRAPLSVLISAATIIDEIHGIHLNAEEHKAAHAITHTANDLIDYLNTFGWS